MSEIYNGEDNLGNAFAHNRKIFTNASQNMPKNSLLVINSNRASNAYHDQGYPIIKNKEVSTIETNKESIASSKLNYFGNRDKRKADVRFTSRESTQKIDKDISFGEFNSRRRSGDDKVKNYYTPENVSAKKAKTNNYMEGVSKQGTGSNKYGDEELIPPNEDVKVGTLKRPKNPTLEVDGRFNSERQHTEKPAFEHLLSEENKRCKPSIESEKLKKVKLNKDESEEAVDE